MLYPPVEQRFIYSCNTYDISCIYAGSPLYSRDVNRTPDHTKKKNVKKTKTLPHKRFLR